MNEAREAACGAVNIDTMMAHVREFAKRIKHAGTPEELESFRYIHRCLEDYGWSAELIRHDAYISLPGDASLKVAGRPIPTITHSFSRSTPGEGLAADIVYAGNGSPAELAAAGAQGKIVLLERIANPAAAVNASKAGALGQIHISPDEHLHEMCVSPVWGSPSDETVHNLPSTVILSIANADGIALKDNLARGERITATMHANVQTGWTQIPLLTAELLPQGAGEDTPFVLFSGHHDTWHYGVMDNGTANATMLEIARLFAGYRSHLTRGLRICFWSGHSQGRYAGSAWYADTHWHELAKRCVGHINVDSTGGRGNTILEDAISSAELFGLAAGAVARQGEQTMRGQRMARAGDQSFWGIGIPSVFMGMGEQPIGAANVMGALHGESNRTSSGFGWWWHTPGDTIDKIDPDLLVRDTRVYVDAIWGLVTDRIVPVDYKPYFDALSSELVMLRNALGGRLDLEPLDAMVQTLRRRAEGIIEARRRVVPEAATKAINGAIIALQRALVPMDYTEGDRFRHDPALTQTPFPVLDPIRRLAAADGEAFKFTIVAARRAYNRLNHALENAGQQLSVIEDLLANTP
ncbi:Peptidase_M28 domain-containing protein [Hyphomicrobiales bacterium]|nr:Peptidase_M28 domain-containing protein [Hyphomicrobiales bacterium]CAH1692886.1 Peptidase_M28 domain-containing protein [Hyphomicrobiales bacterium]